jgi:hypothetical protein
MKKPAINLITALSAPSRPSVMREDIKQGSVLRIKAGTPFGHLLGRQWTFDEDIVLYINKPNFGFIIKADGSLGEEYNLSTHLKWIITGYDWVISTQGLEVVSLGSREETYSAGYCL